MEILHDIWRRIKPLAAFGLLEFLLVAGVSFGLMVSLLEQGSRHNFYLQEKVQEKPAETASNMANFASKYPFFASKSGTKYYSSSCKAGERVLSANRIYFKTAIEAEKRGLSMSKYCVK